MTKAMKRRLLFFESLGLFILTAVLISGCIRFRASALVPPTVVLERAVFCTALDQKNGWAEPIQEKTLFKKGEDSSVYSFLTLKDLQGAHTLFWKWYDSSRRLYRATDKIAIGEEGKVFERYIAWDMVYVSEDKKKGAWTVAIFLDDRLFSAKEFEIK